MTDTVKSWIKENYFLGSIVVAIFTITAYVVNLENRISTLETRGSPHLQVIDNRLTVLESRTTNNQTRLDNVVEIMTRELGKKP